MNTLIRGKNVTFDNKYLNVELEDGRIISTPLNWYPELLKLTIQQLKEYKFICKNTGIEWETIDFQLSIESMLNANSNYSEYSIKNPVLTAF
ncbi:MAG TPA: DUF2442 domain-containing protein [Spirochaetota bacterium]|jgi:hypothetical protein|nr:MAG: hypothetical protein BWX91_01101 [Spirochaetes bacterium ADurb.Bin133]HNZ27746.1 DUF2442 domain-containing protein [Spirochaetota bacterium]HPY88834.1 DUF2442 domain-containing protein [Spirochaetota bacterium]HQB61801.1 DUF2442 domain-containing protein [Spirochaetota bacterium]